MERTCRNGINCWNEKCSFKHPVGWKVCKISCHVYNCNYAHPPQRKGPCKSGASCFNPNCEFLHPLGWTVCSAECINKNCEYAHPPQRNENNLFSEEEENCYQEEKCIDYDCPFSHPPQRKAKCFSGSNCYKYECEFLHPHSRFLCDGSCILFECNKIHPSSRNKPCLSKENCYNLNCKYLHPKYRKQPCNDQEDCKDFYCDKLHPPNRTNPCTQGKTCVNLNCELLHPECKLGIECFDFDCTFRHPHGRTPVCPRKGDCPDMDCEYLHPLNWDPTSKKLKTQYERDIFRNINKLPILNSKDLFIQRLKKEKVLVVTAETGSGKTTQLPQYAAESFQGKVVCTQPRALAAISIAQRIADEFDGSSPGENVGYKVGGKAISGRRIELMTDSNLVNKAQSDPQLSDVSVLIIDEAHERSLFTDIVIGIARLVLKERPNDFYVVIASATIDPKPFLDYFFGSNVNSKPFEVPGRTYPVTVEYNEVLKDEETQNLKSILIPEVVKIMNKYSEGNCLVFLPGSKEIDTAIVEFCNKKKENWIPFPLYGSLPPEAQASVMSFDDNDGKLRMIVFCTNIAETSLTVPNIRVVIDTGLAKEARYDPKRRITVLEQVFISKSSAEQRKGRAGRTAPGNCIRLYSEQKLTRANIEPEILRSSLDLVVLQLKNLNYDPLNFPFLSAPKQEFLQNSIQLLTQFECLDLKQMITKRGKLFSDFPFDPRMSNFIITAQEKFGQGETVTQIVSILTAPGSIFFMGSAKDRKEIKGRIATAASKFNSDLLFLLDTYRNWLNSGSSLVNNKCINCKRVTRKRDDSGCKFCRTQFAVENGLNNKIVEIVRSTELKAKEKLPSSKSPLPLTPLSEVIGYCLLSSFKEQICENLIANNPDAGAYLFDSGGKGTFSTTSALAQKMKSEFEYFIAMSITQLSKDLLIIDQGHPIHTNWIPKDFYQKLKDSSLQVQECYSKPNVNKSFRKYVSEALQNNGEQYSKFTLVLYDNAHTTLRVFGPRDIAKEIKNICETAVSAKLKQEIEKEMTCELSNRIATATVNAGLKIIKVQFSEDVNEVRFIKPPVKNSQELKQWISEKARIPESFIKSCVYYSKSINYNFNIVDEGQSYGIAIFTSKDAANRALTLNNEIKEISIGLKVLWRLSKYISQEEAQKYLHDNSFFPSKFDSFPKFSIKINNFPPDNKIESNLKKLPLNQVGQIRISKTNTQSWIVNILFNSKETRDKALQILHNFSLLNQHFSITTKYGKQKRITPEIIPVDKPSEFTLEFKTITETENFLNNFHYPHNQLLECQATTRVHYPQLYNLDTIGALIAEKYEVRYFANKKEGVTFVTFAGKEPKKCNQAVQAFSSSISPLRVFLGTRKQQLMITELQDLELIDKYSSECGVKVELLEDPKTNLYRKMKIIGPQFSQGVFMSKIGDYTDRFESRYDTIHLSLENQILFRNQREGTKFLKELGESLEGTIQYLPSENAIEIYLYPRKNASVDPFKRKIKQFLQEKGSSSAIEMSKYCVFCGKKGGLCFTICGHHYCPKCLTSNCEQIIKAESEIGCLKCNTPISTLDLKSNLSIEAIHNLVGLGINKFVRESSDHNFTLCPIENCNNIRSKYQGYTLCSSCGVESCALCGVIQNDLHRNKTCQQFKECSVFDLDRIIQRAKDFVNEKWDKQLGNITGIYENPGLRSGCPAIQKFSRALSKCEIENSFYAWHGTKTHDSIKNICHEGWDPKRRSGQAYGRGEYFGQTSAVSAGYSRGLDNMIVALLLQVPGTSTQDNFCYVVDNPIDWQMAFNLPVLVLTYKEGKPPQFETMKIQQPLNLKLPDKINSNDNTSNWKCRFRWHWQKDDSEFEPYSDDINSILENHYSMYQCGQASPQFETRPIVRYVDDLPQVYRIDFSSNTQINASTGYHRQIKRKKMDVEVITGLWQVQDERGNWKNYESLVQSTIETQYRNYIMGCGPGQIQIQFPGRPETYSLNFVDGIQTNLQSLTRRSIRKN